MNLAQRILMARRMGDTPDYDPYWDDVVLLLKGDGPDGSTNITDSSVYGHPVTVYGDTRISTAASAYPGGSSMYFDGSGDYLGITSDQFIMGTNDFTVEGFVKFEASGTEGIFCLAPSYLPGSVVNSVQLGRTINGLARLILDSGGFNASSIPFIGNTFHHFSAVRSSGTIKVFVDGVQVLSLSSPVNYYGEALTVGGFWTNKETIKGYIQYFRVTKGVARYATDFTPPTAPFPTTGP